MIASIDRYQVRRELGRGGMAVVYLASDPRIGREVAIKMLSGALLDDQIYRKRFNREVKAVAALEHPNIVPIYDYGIYARQPYLVMRYMAGGSLATRLAGHPLSLTDTLTLIRRIGEALDEAHSRGIIHRDIKPANILLDQYGKTFLSDFGIVKNIDSKTTPTDPETLAGTPSYMSPEQLQGKELDGRSDVYSVGAMLFELLTGQRPFVAERAVAVALKHLNEPIPNILELNPELPEGIDHLITRAMAKAPQQRYPTVGKLAMDLAEIMGLPEAIPDVQLPPASNDTETGPATDSPLTLPFGESQSQRAFHSVKDETPRPVLKSFRLPAIALIVGIIAVCGAGLLAMLRSQMAAMPPTATPFLGVPTPSSVSVMPGGGTGKIAFVSDIAGAPDIFLLDVDTRSVTRVITGVTRKSDPDWSRDGKSILFLTQDNGQYLIDAMTSDGQQTTALLQEAAVIYSPVWSPDGARIAFTSKREGSPEIYVMNADGTGVVSLTDTSSQNWKPSWSPDGKRLVFYSGRHGNFNIYLINADGSNPIALTDSPAQDYDPVWSPDGKRVAFVSERDGNAEIYVMDADGTDQTRLTDNDAADTSPAWSPDSSLIAFVSRRDTKAEIYMMNADGTDQRRMTESENDALSPDWQPLDTTE